MLVCATSPQHVNILFQTNNISYITDPSKYDIRASRNDRPLVVDYPMCQQSVNARSEVYWLPGCVWGWVNCPGRVLWTTVLLISIYGWNSLTFHFRGWFPGARISKAMWRCSIKCDWWLLQGHLSNFQAESRFQDSISWFEKLLWCQIYSRCKVTRFHNLLYALLAEWMLCTKYTHPIAWRDNELYFMGLFYWHGLILHQYVFTCPVGLPEISRVTWQVLRVNAWYVEFDTGWCFLISVNLFRIY